MRPRHLVATGIHPGQPAGSPTRPCGSVTSQFGTAPATVSAMGILGRVRLKELSESLLGLVPGVTIDPARQIRDKLGGQRLSHLHGDVECAEDGGIGVPGAQSRIHRGSIGLGEPVRCRIGQGPRNTNVDRHRGPTQNGIDMHFFQSACATDARIPASARSPKFNSGAPVCSSGDHPAAGSADSPRKRRALPLVISERVCSSSEGLFITTLPAGRSPSG